MASVIPSIRSVLDDLELIDKTHYYFGYEIKPDLLIHRLRILIPFLLCSRKLSNNVDGSLGSLLVRIEDAVCRNAQKIDPYSLTFKEFRGGYDLEDTLDDFDIDVNSFKEEIDEWYITLSDFLQQTSSPITNEVVEIIDSLLENLVDFRHWNGVHYDGLAEVIEAMEEKIAFLKTFIRFCTLQGIENKQMEDLLSQIEAVAVNAAHLLYMCQFTNMNDKEVRQQMKCKISEMMQKIKPIHPQVYKTYTQALTSAKMSRQLQSPTLEMNDDPIITVKDFIDSLACNLWDMLQLEIRPGILTKDQLQILYEGLRFLRTMLKEQPNKFFDEEMMDLARVVTCDAGVVIFSLYQKDVEIDLELIDLLERIKVIQTEFEGQVPETLTFNLSKTNELGFVDFLLENLMELTRGMSDSNAQNCIQTIHEEFVFLRSFLGEIVELRNENEGLQGLWGRVVELAYRVESLIDPLVVVGDIPDSLSTSFDSITADIGNIKTQVLKIFIGKRQDIKDSKVTRTSSHVRSQSISPLTDEVVGFNDEARSIVDRLSRGSKQLRIAAIVGMPGLGKTTLATKVYNNPSVMRHFHIRAWCSVSQVFDKKKVLLELLNHIVTKLPDTYFVMHEQDLAEELRHRLKGSRYLIFLDDVWDIEAWKSLEGPLPDDSNGSRIILTSRLRDVAMLDEEPLFLRQLTKDESWELLQKKLFHGNDFPPALYDLGMQIAENCKGLPLTIIIVAGLLATVELEGWKEVLKSLSSSIISGVTQQCMNTLELSYKHLPDYLKPCLLYFGAFPEDQEVSVKKLIWLWIAEGFVQKNELKSLEDVATDYIMDLVGRSLVMVAEKRSIGGVKTCRIHDLLHDFCMTKAKEENFLQLLQGCDELLAFNEPHYLRRLCIHSQPEHFKKSKLFCPRIRSLLFFNQTTKLEFIEIDVSFVIGIDVSFVIHIFKLLRVLDIGQIHLGYVFPSEIDLLAQLKYLAVKGEMEIIPSSLGNISHLETLIVDSLKEVVSLPNTLWNLQKLRHLYIKGLYKCAFRLPIGNLDSSSYLYELDSFSGAIISSQDNIEKQMRKFPNIRKLRCKLYKDLYEFENSKKILALDFLSRLESIHLSPLEIGPYSSEFKLSFPANLKRLTLSGFWWPWAKLSTIGKLPNLEVLKLLDSAFSGNTWNMEEGEFSKLRFLKLANLDLVSWTASDDQFPYLQRIVLDLCRRLEEMPSCLEYISTLEMIEASNCSDSTPSLIKQIQEEQMNMGNSALKIVIRTSNGWYTSSDLED